jgi:hypothetical protein
MSKETTTLAIVAIVAAAVGILLLGVAVVEADNIVKQIQAFAAFGNSGCPPSSPAANASKGRCFGHPH